MWGSYKMTNYADDCIHLKACRRICKYYKITKRGCTKNYCTAYENIEDFNNRQVENAYNSKVAAWMFG